MYVCIFYDDALEYTLFQELEMTWVLTMMQLKTICMYYTLYGHKSFSG